jgi:hypothetical protein
LGFFVRAERLDEKTIVHTGHGGGGMTLSWGTSQLAVEDAAASGQPIYAVLGRRRGLTARLSSTWVQRHHLRKRSAAQYDLEYLRAQWAPAEVMRPRSWTPAFDAQSAGGAALPP